MRNYHCLDIEFPDVDFSSYAIRGTAEVSSVHHAHLYLKENEIELRILFDDKTYFGDKLSHWAGKIDWNKFGTYIKVELTRNDTNEDLQKVDLSAAKLCGILNSSNYYENAQKYVILKIDTVKFYWNPYKDEENTGEFYLTDCGFSVVEPFYATFGQKSFLKNDGKFEICRMNDSKMFYKLDKSLFRPEFYFYSKDSRESRTATIVKEPKIQFKYKKGITEKEALLYGNVVLLLASFYHHIEIDYIFRRIRLQETTIEIRNIEQKNYFDTRGYLWAFEINWNFNKFLQASWQEETLKNFDLLSKAVDLFNQSLLVDSSSEFLIRYNIIEICDKQKQSNDKFSFALNQKETKVRQKEALDKLLETIIPAEHENFKKRWQSIQMLLQTKPMKNQLISFLESQNLDTNSFPIKVDDLKKLRDNITHGSIDKVDREQLRRANILLYRINGILILNLMGIKEWKLNTEIR